MAGGVRYPQRIVWQADITLSAAIRMAGGVTEFGDAKKVKLVRGNKVVGTFNMGELAKNPADDPFLLVGDHVIVPE